MLERLNSESLSQLPKDVELPGYDRSRVTPGIVHLGLGAFHRAHQAVVTDMAMAASGDLSWGILGVSLRSPATRDALTPQDGLYTLALRDAGDDGQPTEQLRMVGSVLRIMVAEEDPNAVLERIAYPQTRIVSLTITEKGYSHEPSTGYLRWDDPDILHDLEHPERPRSAIGILTYGLALRRERRLPPLTLLSCDNLHANGDTLCNLVLAFALRLDVTLAAWIDKNCTFPNSMVDRIVPGTLDEDRARISARLGFEDAWPVVGEPYLNWVIEDKFAAGRPAWDLPGGATFVRNAAPYEAQAAHGQCAAFGPGLSGRHAGHAHRQRGRAGSGAAPLRRRPDAAGNRAYAARHSRIGPGGIPPPLHGARVQSRPVATPAADRDGRLAESAAASAGRDPRPAAARR